MIGVVPDAQRQVTTVKIPPGTVLSVLHRWPDRALRRAKWSGL